MVSVLGKFLLHFQNVFPNKGDQGTPDWQQMDVELDKSRNNFL